MIKRFLGIAPQLTEDGAYSPSRLALKLATSSKTDFDGAVYKKAYTGKLKVLLVCTEERKINQEEE